MTKKHQLNTNDSLVEQYIYKPFDKAISASLNFFREPKKEETTLQHDYKNMRLAHS